MKVSSVAGKKYKMYFWIPNYCSEAALLSHIWPRGSVVWLGSKGRAILLNFPALIKNRFLWAGAALGVRLCLLSTSSMSEEQVERTQMNNVKLLSPLGSLICTRLSRELSDSAPGSQLYGCFFCVCIFLICIKWSNGVIPPTGVSMRCFCFYKILSSRHWKLFFFKNNNAHLKHFLHFSPWCYSSKQK